MSRQRPQRAFVCPAEFRTRDHLLAGVAAFFKADAAQRLQVRCLRNKLRAVCSVNDRQTRFDVQRQPLLAVVELRFAAQRLGHAFGSCRIRD